MAFVYSCCFWFSLRLGGILIGLFSLFQGILVLIASGMAHAHAQQLKEDLVSWSDSSNFVYSNEYVEQFMTDPMKHISLVIGFTCVYIIACIMYVYGAYQCNNILMITYIIMEFFRLVVISLMVATVLLLLKENTMDIGLLIGASVIGGFFLLGMFYLWICAANLPILINEMERDEQANTIAKLHQLLEGNQRNTRRDVLTRYGVDGSAYNRQVAVVNRNRGAGISTITLQ